MGFYLFPVLQICGLALLPVPPHSEAWLLYMFHFHTAPEPEPESPLEGKGRGLAQRRGGSTALLHIWSFLIGSRRSPSPLIRSCESPPPHLLCTFYTFYTASTALTLSSQCGVLLVLPTSQCIPLLVAYTAYTCCRCYIHYIVLYAIVYYCMLLYTTVYYCILLYTIVYYSIALYSIVYAVRSVRGLVV